MQVDNIQLLWRHEEIKAMSSNYHPYDYRNNETHSQDDGRRQWQQHPSFHDGTRRSSRDRESVTPSRPPSANRSHYVTSPFDFRDERSAFSTYGSNQPTHVQYPAEERNRAMELESPANRYHDRPVERTNTQSPYHYSHPRHQHRNSYYDYSTYYPPAPEVSADVNRTYESWRSGEQEPFNDHPRHHQDYHHSDYTPIPHQHSPVHSGAYQSGQHQGHIYHQGETPPMLHSSSVPGVNETPSAVTEGTTPSSVARRGVGLELTPLQAAAGKSHFNHPRSNSHDIQFDDRKPSAIERPDVDDIVDQKIIAHDLLKTPSPPSDYEPIPLDQFSQIPPEQAVHIPQQHEVAQTPTAKTSISVAKKTPSPPPPPASTKKHRKTPQYLYPSVKASSSDCTVSEGGSWEKRYNELLEFKAKHNHCDVPQNYQENSSLGIWVNKQRMEQKNRVEGKQSSMNDSRLHRLQSIGFKWAKRKGQASWDEKFNELEAYKNKFGNCHVPTKYKDNTALGRWVSTQRAEYKKYQEGDAKTSMNADKIRRLESIGFAWFMAL